MKNDGKKIIKIFTLLILKLNNKAKFPKDFYNDNLKIWIYTNAAKIMIDIENIIQVV